ncbi:MAG: hypothetical protein U5K79_24855 [Cyclobacteriaceae bacterium]|nr:hypothetical protein [Cyclobacteriaceae bacterium]
MEKHLNSIQKILAQYGLKDASIKRIAGYDNANYLVVAENKKYVFKSYPYSKELNDLLIAETELLEHLNAGNSSYFPKPVKSTSNASVFVGTVHEEERFRNAHLAGRRFLLGIGTHTRIVHIIRRISGPARQVAPRF